MRCLSRFVGLMLLMVTAGCRAAQGSAQPFVIELDGAEIRYRGKITAAGADALARALARDSFSEVKITSAGGDAPAALRIGKIIRDKHLRVTVERYCVSACAQYVFVAGTKKRLDPGAVVIFHDSPGAMEAALRNSPLARGAQLFAREAGAERKFYQSLGVTLNLAGLSSLLKPVCVIEMPNRALNDPYRYGVAWKFQGFVPTRKQLTDAGINNIEGTFPTATTLSVQLHQVGFKPEYKPLIDPNVDLTSLSTTTQNLPICPSKSWK